MNKRLYNVLVRSYYQCKRKLIRLITLGKNIRKQEILSKRIRRLRVQLMNMQCLAKKSITGASILTSIALLPSFEAGAQTFAAKQNIPFSLGFAGTYSTHSFADFDADGDLDLMTGSDGGAFRYYQNTGTSTAPDFAAPIVNPYSLISPYSYSSPTLVDLDGDGDFDLMSGSQGGMFFYFENTGSPVVANFGPVQLNPFSLTYDSSFSTPSFADLDNDGDLDLIAGQGNGEFKYFENIGDASNPNFGAMQTNPFSLSAITNMSSPSFIDIDGDGDYDILGGIGNGDFKFFENIGDAFNPNFGAVQTNPFFLEQVNPNNNVAFGDLDGDSDLDFLAGDRYGNRWYFQRIVPEINVLGNGNNIVDGDNTPSATDDTEFGSQDFCSGDTRKTFTIQNTGVDAMRVYSATLSGTNAGEFDVFVQPAGTVSASGTTTFQVLFNPISAGSKNATVTISCNDSDESIYNFDVHGTATDGTPSITGTTPGSTCGTGTVALAATASAGTLNWYDAPSGGTLVGSGTSITTPSISSSTNYYVESVLGSCHSGRTAVLATTGPCTQMRSVYCGSTLSAFNQYLSCDAVTGATQYCFEITDGSNTYNYVSSTVGIRLNLVSGIKYGTTYSIRAAAQVGGVWLAYGSACSVTTPLTQVQPWYCGLTLSNISDYMACYPVEGATQYKFEISEGTNVYTYTSNSVGMRFSNFTNVKYNTSYSIRVSAKVGGTFSAYGASCNVTTPLTNMQSWYCGITVSPMNQYLACYQVAGATQYKFKLYDGTNTLYFTSSSIGLRMSLVPGIQTNTTYEVSVASYVGGSWSAYGTSCNITSAATMSAMQQDDEIVIAANENLMEEISIEAYPNPNAGNFVIRSTHDGEFILTNELGQILQSIHLNEANKREMNLEQLGNGVYFVSGCVGNQQISKKIIVI